MEKVAIVCFSDICWDFIWQRHQSLLTRFPREWPILYIEPTSLVVLIAQPRRFLTRKVDNITIVSLPSLPLIDHIAFLRPVNDLFVRIWLLATFRAHSIKSPMLLYYAPRFASLIGRLGERLVAYDCADDRMAFSRVPKWMKPYVEDLLKKSDIVFATSENLRAKALEFRKKGVHLIGNGVDADLFLRSMGDMPIPDDMKGLKRPIIGYFGVIDDWMDIDLIREISIAYPDASIVLLGPMQISPEGQQKLMSCQNVFLPGPKPHDALPGYLKAFDVCIIPFKINELTKSVNPVKMYEYLAGGKNVVSITMAEVDKYGGVVYIARSHDDFIQKIADALRNKPDVDGMRAVVNENTWDSKAKAMVDILHRSIDAGVSN